MPFETPLAAVAVTPAPSLNHIPFGPVVLLTSPSFSGPSVVINLLPAVSSNSQSLPISGILNIATVAPGFDVPSPTVILPLSNQSLALTSLSALGPPQDDSYPLTSAPLLPSVAVTVAPPLDLPVTASETETEWPWWIITEFLEPHGLPAPTFLAIPPPPLLLPLPDVNEQSDFPASAIAIAISPSLATLSSNPYTSLAVSTEPAIIESGTVVDKVYTWILYSTGTAQIDNTFLSPVTGPLQAFLPDGTRVGMDSAGLYIGWVHRVPYPPEFSSIIQGYWLPAPQLFL